MRRPVFALLCVIALAVLAFAGGPAQAQTVYGGGVFVGGGGYVEGGYGGGYHGHAYSSCCCRRGLLNGCGGPPPTLYVPAAPAPVVVTPACQQVATPDGRGGWVWAPNIACLQGQDPYRDQYQD